MARTSKAPKKSPNSRKLIYEVWIHTTQLSGPNPRETPVTVSRSAPLIVKGKFSGFENVARVKCSILHPSGAHVIRDIAFTVAEAEWTVEFPANDIPAPTPNTQKTRARLVIHLVDAAQDALETEGPYHLQVNA